MPLCERALLAHSRQVDDHTRHVEKPVEEQSALDGFLAGDSWCWLRYSSAWQTLSFTSPSPLRSLPDEWAPEMRVCVSWCQLSGLWQPHLGRRARDQGNKAKKKEVLSCLSEQFNSVVSVKTPCSMSSDSSAQALLCQLSVLPRQCQNCHTQPSWGTSGGKSPSSRKQ